MVKSEIDDKFMQFSFIELNLEYISIFLPFNSSYNGLELFLCSEWLMQKADWSL